MKTSEAGKSLIKHFESCQLIAYPDPATGGAPWTCGWGSTGPDIFEGIVWSQSYADKRFEESLVSREQAVNKLVSVPLEQHQFDALVSFVYNLGAGNLASSTLLRKLNAKDYPGAANEFVRWNRAAGRIMRGLTRRRYAERAFFNGLPLSEALEIGERAA